MGSYGCLYRKISNWNEYVLVIVGNKCMLKMSLWYLSQIDSVNIISQRRRDMSCHWWCQMHFSPGIWSSQLRSVASLQSFDRIINYDTLDCTVVQWHQMHSFVWNFNLEWWYFYTWRPEKKIKHFADENCKCIPLRLSNVFCWKKIWYFDIFILMLLLTQSCH